MIQTLLNSSKKINGGQIDMKSKQTEIPRASGYLYHLRLRLADGHEGNWYLLVCDHAQLEKFIGSLDPSVVLLSNQLIAFKAKTLSQYMNFFIDLTEE